MITLTGSAISDGAVIEIYDAMEQLVATEVAETNGRAEVGLSPNAGGVYFVSVHMDNVLSTQKFCLQGN